MKKIVLLILIGIFFQSAPVMCQNIMDNTTLQLPKRFKVGDRYYDSSFKGLNIFMNEIENQDPDLYNKLVTEFDRLKYKRNKSLIAITTGGAIGTGLIIGSFSFLRKTHVQESVFDIGSQFYEPPKEVKEINYGVMASGFGCYVIGFVVGVIIAPDNSDIYNFINMHNQHNPKAKMDWQIGLDYKPGQQVGLKLNLRF